MEPLASKYRPKNLDEFVGQQKLVGKNGPIRQLIERKTIPSMIFWGPPGTGKTTLAYIISQLLDYDFHRIQAVTSGKDTLRKILKIAIKNLEYNKKTILFLDEIHRWNKAQQDALLPFVEKGIIILIGATTENPSFSINSALLSRTRVFVFEQHTIDDISVFLSRVCQSEAIKCSSEILKLIGEYSNGDLRNGINILEIASGLADGKEITQEIIENAIQKNLYFDKNGEEHFNIISAIHKSMRASDADAAVYWTVRMLESGEDPLYIARRMLRFASEDIGNSDINALVLANTVFEACAKIGRPECDIFLVQLAIYLSNAPKDNSAYTVLGEVQNDVRKHGNLPVPMNIRNAPTKLMKNLGYGKGYVYDHDIEGKKSGQQCLPDKLAGKKYIK